MSEPFATSAQPFIGGVFARRGPAPIWVTRAPAKGIPAPAPPAPTPSLPLLSSRSGNLFQDSVDAGLHWYLPSFALASDPDAAFAFAATQSGLDSSGAPSNTATVSLRITLGKPDDVTAFASANPNARLQAIPLEGFNATLSSSYLDAAGAAQQRQFAGALQSQSDGGAVVTISAISGDAVPELFQDLKLAGKAALTLGATFQAWTTRWVFAPHPQPPPKAPIHPIMMRRAPLAAAAEAAVPPPILAHPFPIRSPIFVHPFPIASGTWVAAAAAQSWTQTLPLGLKYDTAAYEFQFTLASPGQPNAVLSSVDQLKSFDAAQPEFIEITSLGVLGATWPTLARAFHSRFTDQVVLVPQRYALMRGKAGVSAACLARLDPSSAQPGASRFEFNFVVAPYVSGTDVQAFSLALQKLPQFKASEITFPILLAPTGSSLQTAFGNSASFCVGPAQHTFAITLPVIDGGAQAPAVADANLIIQQLCSAAEADLLGTLNLSIDPASSAPIQASVDLNFFRTVGTDDLTASIDPATSDISLVNASALDLTIRDFAVMRNGVLTAMQPGQTVAAGASIELTWPPDLAPGPAAQIIVDAELKLASPVPPAEVMGLINLSSVNVTNTQLFMAVDASAVDFSALASLGVVVVFAAASGSPPTSFTLTKAAPVASGQVTLPLEVAIYSLLASVQVTVVPSDPTARTYTFDLQHNFNAEPTVSIEPHDIISNKPS